MRTGTIQAEGAVFRVAIYTGIPKESKPTENTRPEHSEYYEWTGFTNLRLDEQGCLRPGKLLSWSFHRKAIWLSIFRNKQWTIAKPEHL